MDGVPRVPEQRVPESREELRFSILGPVRVWRGDEPLSMGSPQQRALLAALLLRDGRTATAAELIDALWGDEPPSQALAAVRTYASRLRKVLDSGVLVSESGGYAIRLSDSEAELDLSSARSLAADAEKAKHTGDLGHARDVLNQALSLWVGEPLSSVPGPYAETQRARLEEWRLQLLESRLDMDLELGAHAEAVSELTALTAAHPLRERLRELLMLALYRSGRQAEALAVYADTRRLLADELGVDPRPGLKELQQRILHGDDGLTETPATDPEPAVTPARPAQLPAMVYDFTGRAPFVEELTHWLGDTDERAMAISVVGGIGGVGKTTLAVHAAHAARSAFPDGQLYVDLGGMSRSVDPYQVLGSFLRALGVADGALPDSLEDRAALYRSSLDGRRVLVLLDNARDAAQVRPLLPGSPGCATLVTSRARMVDLEGAHLVDIDVMSPEEALVLFARIVGEERVAAEREVALEVVEACGFLPLAIRIAASRLAARRTWTVSVLAAKLADERHRLDELQAGDLAVKATFELGYGQLEPAQARVFRLLGLADGPDISLTAAAAVLDLPVENVEDLLEALVDASLLEGVAPGRYRYHDLVRLFARFCAERDDPQAGERDAALSRLLDFYLATAARVYSLERPGNRLVEQLAPTRHEGLAFAGREEALEWLFTEGGSLLSLARQVAPMRQLRKAVDLLLAAHDLAESGSYFELYRTAATALRDASVESGDQRAEARVRVLIARVYCLAGDFGQADAEADRAMLLSGSGDDPWPTGDALQTRGVIALYEGRYTEGETFLRRALECFYSYEDEPAAARALCSLSRVHVATGRAESAVELARQGFDIYDRMGQTLPGAHARYALGLALTEARSFNDALDAFNEAREVFQDSRQQLWEGMTLVRIAEVHLALRAPSRAVGMAEQSLALIGGMGGERRRADILTVLGRALHGIHQLGRAAACWKEALSIYEELGSPEARDIHALLASGSGRLSSIARVTAS